MNRYSPLLFRKSALTLSAPVLTFLIVGVQSFFWFVASVAAATPVISNVTAGNLLTNGATISWSTDVAADTQVEYGPTTAYGSSTALNSTLVTAHSQTLTGLQANQLYNYRVKSRDASGDLAVSANRTFITPSGTTAVGGSTDSSNSNTMNTTRFTTVHGGTVASLSVYVGAVDSLAANRSFQLALYTANGTAPGALIAHTATGTLTANSWNTLPISAALAPNTGYFIAYNTNGRTSAVNNMRYTSGGVSGWSTSGQAFGTWPASFGGFSSQSATFSLYATFVGDLAPPTVTLTGPQDGATVSGLAALTAEAADETAVQSVQFQVGGANLGAPDTTAPYSVAWDTAQLLDGPQVVTAIATDTAGNTAASAPFTIHTANPTRMALNQPAAGQNIAGTTFTAAYTRMGDWANGKHVHFRLDGGTTKMDLNSDGNQAYAFSDVPGGSHTLEYIVADGAHAEMPGTGGTVSFTTIAPDTTAPTAAITAPANGATVQHTITVTADAADDRDVVDVQFLLDGAALGAPDATAPYSVSWNTTTAANGSHTLTARARDSLNQTVSAPVTVTVSNTDPRAVLGEWGSAMDWPLVAVHATLFHTGEILMWDAWDAPNTDAKLWNPATNTWTDVPLSIPNSELFCAGQATGSTGDLVVMGGHATSGTLGTKTVFMFDPLARTWTRKADMGFARWYPSVTQMADNRMVTFSGQSVAGTWVPTPEIFNPATNTVTQLPFTTPELAEIQYPQTSLLPSGNIVAISSEHGGVMLYNPALSSWNRVGTSQRPYGVWTSFAPGKYLITGGGNTFTDYHDMPDDPNAMPSQTATRILDMTTDVPQWSDGGAMHHGRSFHNVTMLPTGKALAIGGANIVSDFARPANATLTAEEWDPATNTWTEVAAPAKPRMYHSVSVLLPDGRVLSAGGGRLAPAADQLNAQIYSPSYLFRGPRPAITSAPATIQHGSTMDLATPNAANIGKVTMSTLASVTHATDWNQHFMELPFTRSGDTLTVQTPASANLMPENYYMVFIVDTNGVPSEAKIVKLGTPAPDPDNTPPTVNVTAPANGSTVSGSITVSAAAADNIGVAGVQFKLDGANLGSEDTTSPYSVTWNTAAAANGSHTLTAVARDAAGNTTAAAVTVTVANTTPSPGGLVASYGFNEGTGTTVADGSGNNNSGSIFQAAWFAGGRYGSALTFDGSNDYVSVPDAASLDLTNRMTLEAWIRPNKTSGWRTVLMKENGTAELAYALYAREASNRPSAWIRLNPTSGSSQSAAGSTGLPLNTWSHLAATYDGTTLRTYVNGVQVGSRAISGNMYTSSSPLKFGGNAIWGEYYGGQIDEIRIYNRALSAAEIQTDMNTPL